MKAAMTINISKEFDQITAKELMATDDRILPSVGRAKKLIEAWPGKKKTRTHRGSRTIRLYPTK